ncbi:F-box/FBD/LRR-repeat protein [Senna tora]|uniref:F-box/FBD/LRR-repeat protein n=1 Tax=Senna tora TaxID=362788 RepID=A0A834WJH9_9FABA|nr:F-box/FBD/LRR-repeat protein [Senna tora]
MAEAEPISRRRQIHNTGVTVYRDRFSDLSDSLICHILSYIPTKEAVATSILAKRWKPLWRYTHSIDFDDHKYKNNETRYSRFVHFVNTILFSLDNSHPIKRFHLKSKSTFTSNENMNVWVNFALQHKVEHLEIESGQITTKLPSSIFTCKTIVVMKLHQAKFDDAISSIRLPSLRTLHLCDVFFSSSWCLVELLSNCELLENLVINNIITQTHTGFVYMGISLSVNLLTTIDLPKLISAEVYFSNHWVVLTALSKAKFLLFDLKKCYHRDVRIPIFQNLAHLELRFDVDYDWNYLAKILQNSPNLQILVLKARASLNLALCKNLMRRIWEQLLVHANLLRVSSPHHHQGHSSVNNILN